MVDSPLGKIPQGWEVRFFTDIADVLSGGTPSKKNADYWAGNIPFFTPKDALAAFYVSITEEHITEGGLNKCSSQLYSPETIFITARGTVGKVIMSACDMAMNQSCYALKGKDGTPQLYLFLLTLDSVAYLKKNTGGATFDTIIVDTFRRLPVITPPKILMADFTDCIRPCFDTMKNLLAKNSLLRQTRDLLLPKLISGEVDVSELNIRVVENSA